MRDWYAPREIIFNRVQMFWLIEHLPSLREGIYPPEPTSYSDMGRRTRRHYGAYFETPCQFAAEVDIRLNKTGIEGKLLVAEIQSGKELEELEPESRRALNYISGWRRKRTPYRMWVKQYRYRMGKAN